MTSVSKKSPDTEKKSAAAAVATAAAAATVVHDPTPRPMIAPGSLSASYPGADAIWAFNSQRQVMGKPLLEKGCVLLAVNGLSADAAGMQKELRASWVKREVRLLVEPAPWNRANRLSTCGNRTRLGGAGVSSLRSPGMDAHCLRLRRAKTMCLPQRSGKIQTTPSVPLLGWRPGAAEAAQLVAELFE